MARPSEMLLTVKAPSGTATMAGWGLCPRRCSALSMTSEIGSMDLPLWKVLQAVRVRLQGQNECERRAGGTLDAARSTTGYLVPVDVPNRGGPPDVFPPLRLRA